MSKKHRKTYTNLKGRHGPLKVHRKFILRHAAKLYDDAFLVIVGYELKILHRCHCHTPIEVENEGTDRIVPARGLIIRVYLHRRRTRDKQAHARSHACRQGSDKPIVRTFSGPLHSAAHHVGKITLFQLAHHRFLFFSWLEDDLLSAQVVHVWKTDLHFTRAAASEHV
jgi:hypothetical protein